MYGTISCNITQSLAFSSTDNLRNRVARIKGDGKYIYINVVAPIGSEPVPVEDALIVSEPSAVDFVVPPVVYSVAPDANHLLPPSERENAPV